MILFYSCDYNKYTLAVIKKVTSLKPFEVKEEIKMEYEPMEVDENNVISIL